MGIRTGSVRWSTIAFMLGLSACYSVDERDVMSRPHIALMADMPTMEFRELHAGSGRPVLDGDRVTIRVVGEYARGSQRFAEGEITFISGSHPNGNLLGPAAYAARVGARRHFTHYIASDSSTGTRVTTYGGMFPEREFFRYRNDRGGLAFETEVLSVCRPRQIAFMEGSKFAMRFSLGCH